MKKKEKWKGKKGNLHKTSLLAVNKMNSNSAERAGYESLSHCCFTAVL